MPFLIDRLGNEAESFVFVALADGGELTIKNSRQDQNSPRTKTAQEPFGLLMQQVIKEIGANEVVLGAPDDAELF